MFQPSGVHQLGETKCEHRCSRCGIALVTDEVNEITLRVTTSVVHHESMCIVCHTCYSKALDFVFPKDEDSDG